MLNRKFLTLIIIYILVILVPSYAYADAYKMNPYTGKLDNIGSYSQDAAANAFCRANGTNCPAGSTNYWEQVGGSLYPATITDNVGIGTVTPETKLHVYRGVGGGSDPLPGIDPFVVENNDTAYINIITPANRSGGFFFSDGTRAMGVISYDHAAGYGPADSLNFATNGGGADMSINSAGNVGIGTILSLSKLDVTGSNNTNGVTIRELITSGARGSYLDFANANTGSNDPTGTLRFYSGGITNQVAAITTTTGSSAATGIMTFSTNNGAGITEKMRLQSNGNFGIGTAAPLALFHAYTTAAQDIVKIEDADADPTPAFMINSAGNIGMGTTPPSATPGAVLHIQGVAGTTSALRLSNANATSSGTMDQQYGLESRMSFTSGTNMGGHLFHFEENQETRPIARFSGSADRNALIVNSTGNVGIGTFTGVGLLTLSSTDANNLFRVDDNGPGDTSPTLIDTNGNVAIGTTAAAEQLHVTGGAGGATIAKFQRNSGADAFVALNGNGGNPQLNFDGALGTSIWSAGVLTGTNGFAIQKSSAVGLNTNPGIVIDTNGNVGLGTFASNAILDISSTAAQDLFRINDNGVGDTSPFVVDMAGNVGIGSVAPGTSLDVQGTIRASTGTAGQATCWKADKSLGQCTSAVGAGGACTCS